MNNALLYLGGLLIAALALLFAAPRFIDWNSYRGVFEEEASRILGREVRVGGAVNLSLLPAPYVSFERLRIADTSDEGASSIIRVESFTMRLSVPPLLKGLIEAHRVELRRPVLNLVINDAGGGNWQSLALAPGALPFVPKDVTLQSVEIEDGAIIVSSPGQHELARFDAINGELTAEALEGPFKYRGTVNWQDAPRQVRIATAQIDANGDLRFKAAVDVTDSKNAYLLDGRLRDLNGRPSLEGALTARLALARGATASAAELPPPAPAADASDLTEALDFDLEDENAAGPSADPPASAAAEPSTAPSSFELKSKVTGTTSGVALEDIAISLEAGATPQLISGEARLDWASGMRLDVALTSRWLDLDQIAEVTTKQMPLEAGRSYFEALASALPAAADTNARLEFDQLTLGGEPIGNVRLAARRAGGPLKLDQVRADLPGGVRLELDGILTPTDKVPRLDGTLFVSGKSLMRFLAWGLDNAEVGLNRNDGPFSLDGRFALGDGTLALTDAALEFAGTPLTGEITLDLGARQKLDMAIEGPRVDVAQLGSGAINLRELRDLLIGEDTGGASPAAPPSDGFDAQSADFSIDLKVAELVDGSRVLKDVDAVVRLEQGTLSIPRLKFSTPEGLLVEAEGGAKEVPARPQGTLRGLVAAPNPRAARAFLELIDGEDGTLAQDFDRIAGVAPLRLAWTLDLAGGETQATRLSLDGTLGGGRMAAALSLDGGRSQWRTQPLDIKASLENPNIARLVATLLDVPIAADATERSGGGRAVLKAAGIPADGLLALADVTADGLVLGYRGEIALAAPGDTRLDGELRVRAADARVPLALAGLDVANGIDGVALAGTVTVRHEAGRLALKGQGLRLGDSTLSGEVAVAGGEEDERGRFDATLTADRASVAALLAPITRKAEAAPEEDEQSETATASAVIWPDQPFDVAPLARRDGKIAARIGALVLEPGLTISDAHLDIELAQDTIKITRLDGGAVGGRLASSFEIERAAAGVGLSGAVDISIGGEAETPASDAVQFSASFTSRAFSPAAVVATLSGKGELTVGDATLNGNSPAAVSAVVRAALTGQGPAGGEDFAQAIADALKDGEVQLGKLTIPVQIEDGALKLDRVRIDMSEGRSTFATVVELASMRIDSEWQIEPKLDDTLAATPQQAQLPPVTVVYTGKLSELDALEPVVSAGALERELVVRKMEFDVGELERLRKLDEERARQDAERRRALEAERARQEAERQRALEEERAREEARRALEEDTQLSDPNAWEPAAPTGPGGEPQRFDDGAANPAAIGEGQGALPQVTPSPTASRPPPRRRKQPVDEEWRPFQSSPF